MKIPTLVLAFNRPELLKNSLIANANSGIETVFVHLDGPRENSLTDHKLIQECKEVVNLSSNLFRHVKTFQSESNLGCRLAVREGLDWFFNENECGIIVEDDILISKNFVDFASSMLTIKQNSDIWAINGWSPFNSNEVTSKYFRTRYFVPWGWATWSDKWSKYQENVIWSKESLVRNLGSNRNKKIPQEFENYWNQIFSNKLELSSTWDYQWQYTIWKNNGYCISPIHRLTTNNGFGKSATHTHSTSFRSDLRIVNAPVEHDEETEISEQLDHYLGKLLYNISDNSEFHSSAFFQRYKINKIKNYSPLLALIRSIFYPGLSEIYFTRKKIGLFLLKLIPFIKKKLLIQICKKNKLT